ncbi:HTTM domain-containing protein [Streptomyces sp. NPDC054884]|uniref:HTTM domain-containing protein n=1 Tax=Streptomyces sp. ME08-AFT2 TaxID=3028683 RepID=UPI0029B10939|nr:HTTM domain-containing protein [Streptomyces sp. ME08-AFT2]MDX3309115.1 HTTM domain-containing protein [Streptomyces sp. ME08-AFT2]
MNRFSLSVSAAIARLTESALGPYQSAVVRIGFSATWLLFLLREFPHRQELYGPDGPWDWELARQLIDSNGSFTVLMWSDGQVWFEVVYALAIVAGALLLLGWRTRAMSVLFMVGVLSLQNRSVFMGDGGDNVLHLMSVYLMFLRCGRVWSLDARRARRTQEARARGERVTDRVGPVLWAASGTVLVTVTVADRFPSEWTIPALLWAAWAAQGLWWAAGRLRQSAQPRILLDVIGNVLHNGALAVIMVEACLIYATAGWYKIQGSRWQDGTAAYYPLHLDYFSPWPALADLLAASGTMVLIATYGTVIVQVAFPFTLFNRRLKNVLLALMMAEHAVIAVLLGLPFFSLAMIATDSVFLPTPFLHRVGGWAARVREALLPDRGQPLPDGVPSGEVEARGRTAGSRGQDHPDPAHVPAATTPGTPGTRA